MKNQQRLMKRRLITLVVLFSTYFILLLGGIFLYNWQSSYAEIVYIVVISIIFPDLIGLTIIPNKGTKKAEKIMDEGREWSTLIRQKSHFN